MSEETSTFKARNDDEEAISDNQDEQQLQLHRSWNLIESFATKFCALNFIGGVRSYLITILFMLITAAVLAEICSALPLNGSIYIWAAESASPKYARFFGFIVAWWSCTAWMTFAAGNCQTTANYIVSQLAFREIGFPGGISNDNVKWRALIWAISEALLVVAVAINYLPPRMYSAIFRLSVGLMMLDFFLPGNMTGFDAVVAGKGILTSAFATGVLGFATAILFLFCTPDLDTLFALEAPQPFVIFMTAIAVIGLILSTSVAIVAASRLVFAVARDGVLPLSGWISTVTADGQPKNAVAVIFVCAAVLLCTILPSQVAFTSLVSARGVPTIAAYSLIALLRLTMTPGEFYAAFFNALVFAVLIPPFFFPAPVIFGIVTVFGVASWYFTPEDKWLRRELVLQALHPAEGSEHNE
ncbi:hypothetical protein B0H17DRAFT_1158533 [Mycena rosella]|uniref:Amino acid transporter n=1 Tax=Mycena rosella TaxID=1033263 RepID=A0AAD7GNY6_MYCRO|nr:hypothetical protein B0H17DRAFT_1158533 [Mycena rosella]